MGAKYIFAGSRLRADVAIGASGLPVLTGDGAKFVLSILEYTYLRITDGRNSEIVRYSGGPISLDTIPVTRAQLGTRAFVWSKGACVESILTSDMLLALVQDQCGAAPAESGCGSGCALPNQILGTNNTWTGVNAFRDSVAFGTATVTPADSSCPAVRMNAGWAVAFDSDAACDLFGFAASVRRTFGTASTTGGAFHAGAAIGVNGVVCGVSGLAEAEEDSAASLLGSELTVRNRENSNSSEKSGLLLNLENRIDPADPVILGANRYNINSAALRVVAQAPSSAGEYLGWERGIVFEAGSLSRSLVDLAVGIDFAGLTSADVANIEAAVRLRSGMAFEMNGDTGSYDSKKFLYSAGNRQFQLMDYANARFGVDAKSAILYLSDVAGAPGTLLANLAGAPSGKFLNIFCNGVRYKIQLLNA